jgi:hypothetical protein
MRIDLRKGIFTLALVSLVLGASSGASAAHGTEPGPEFGMKVLDVALVRPASLVGATISSAVFLGTLPLTFLTGVGVEASDYLVVAPWRFTALRYLGDFNSYTDSRSITGRVKTR